jgi:tetratricopeptide (TPR) repeat protein
MRATVDGRKPSATRVGWCDMRVLRRAAAVCVGVFVCACVPSASLPPRAIALNRDGAHALAEGDLVVAEARIGLALEYSPGFIDAWVNLGLVELARGNFERAHHDFIVARDLNPDLPAPLHALGLLADRQGHSTQAQTLYRAALEADPGFGPARASLASLFFERGALEDAREQFLRLTQIAPDSVDGWAGLCESLLRLHRSDDAEQALIEGVRRLGRRPRFDLLEGRLFLQVGAFADAEDRLEPLTQSPNRKLAAIALAWTALARLRRGDAAAAVDASNRATSLDPGDGVVRYAVRATQDAFQKTPR